MTSDKDNNAAKADIYKDTVFLPRTDFPMRAGLAQKEPEILKKWNDIDLYGQMRALGKGRQQHLLHDGPPYANGHIHIGHALNKVLKDFVNRSFFMMGYDTPYIPGWDCHGLPIEWKVEEQYREKGWNKDEVAPLDFRAECRDYARKFVDIQSGEFQRLGVAGDWKNPYLTMTHGAESVIVQEIHKFLLNGSLYKGLRPVLWSVVEKTALAEAEVEYREHKSVTVWVKFPVVETALEDIQGASIVIWTTTPWTLPSNRGVAYGKDIEYGVYEIKESGNDSRAKVGDRVALALSLAENVKQNAKIEEWELLSTFRGQDMEGTICAHPLCKQGYEFDVPALAADFVTEEAGTGFVHVAPSHGADDFYLGKENGLEITDNVSDDGKFRDHVPLFAGLEVYTEKGEMGGGNFAVLKAMDEAGALLAKGSLRHEYPHSWRSKAPLIFRTTPQWFIAMDDERKLRVNALKAIENTRWVPAQGESRIRAMVESRPDWCISRQRAWGVPIALFLDKKTGEPLKDENVLARIADAFRVDGADAWWSRDPQEFLGNNYSADDYDQVFDIVDVWFESGSTHAFVVEQNKNLQWPAQLYLEGSDQHRGWFQSSLLESCGTRGRAPFETVLTHGFVLDEKGYKMSKSAGNVVAPQDVWDQQGADILRLWVASSDYAEDLRLGPEILKSTTDLYRRIRNTFRFLLGALADFSAEEKLTPDEYGQMPELERLVLHRLYEMNAMVRRCIRDFDFPEMTHKLHNFCAVELSSLYFDIRKDRLYCDKPDSFERRACRTVMYHLFDCLTGWFAPILCFTAEEAWEHRPDIFGEGESIHLRPFAPVPDSWRNDELAVKWEKVRKVRRVVLGAIEPHRKDKNIGSSLEAHPQIFVTAEYEKALEGISLPEICITSQAVLSVGSAPDNAYRLDDAPGVGVVFEKAAGDKCERCWQYLPEVGSDKSHPDLCARCTDAVTWHEKNRKAA